MLGRAWAVSGCTVRLAPVDDFPLGGRARVMSVARKPHALAFEHLWAGRPCSGPHPTVVYLLDYSPVRDPFGELAAPALEAHYVANSDFGACRFVGHGSASALNSSKMEIMRPIYYLRRHRATVSCYR